MGSFDPFVSVIVPAKNEQDFISKCLQSLVDQNYPKERFEVIVIDNMSIDRTAEIAHQFDIAVKQCDLKKIGAIRNYGVSLAKGDYIAFLDADCVAPKDWIRNAVKILSSRPELGSVGGYFHCQANANWLQHGWAPPQVENQEFVSNLATGSLIIPRAVFIQFGPFNETISTGEDTELTNKIWTSGLKLLRSPEVSVIHLDFPASITSFLKRQIRQASNYFQLRRKGIDKMFWGVVVFASSLFLSLVFLVLKVYFFWILFTFIYFFCWLVYAVKDIFRTLPEKRWALLLPIFITRGLYLVGRSIGIFFGIKRLLLRKNSI